MIQNRSNLNQENFMIPSSKKFRIAVSCTCTLFALFLRQVDDQNTSMLDRIKNLPMLQSSQLHSSLQLEDRITEDPEPACVRDGNPHPLAGKTVAPKRKALLDTCKLYHFISFNYDLVSHVCTVDEEDWCSVFCDGDHVWITGLYGFHTESGNLAEITTQTMNKLKGLCSYTSAFTLNKECTYLLIHVYIVGA